MVRLSQEEEEREEGREEEEEGRREKAVAKTAFTGDKTLFVEILPIHKS